jgi:hypothetical protein
VLSSSLAWRASIAVAMLVGFYVLAIAIMLLLLYLPIVMWQFIYALKEWEWQCLQILTVVVWFFCLTFAVSLGSAIFPRPGHFEPPGPRLRASDHPALFALLRETAKAVDQAMPAEVFLTLDWSAWVTERGGIALAARTVGAGALARGLRILHGAGPAFEAYVKQEFDPVLSAGYRPPFAEGFARFVRAPSVALMIGGFLEEEIKTAKAGPYDGHPPQRDRLARLEGLPAGKPLVDDPPAISLLQNVPELEKQLLAAVTGKTGNCELPAVEWDDIGPVVYLPSYRKMLEEHGGVLRGITPAMLPEAMTSTRFVNYLAAIGKGAADPEAAIDQAAYFSNDVIGAALVNLLLQRGWSMEVALGMPVTLRLGQNCIEPFTILPRFVDRSLTAEVWREECEALGIADVDLGSVPIVAEEEKKEN